MDAMKDSERTRTMKGSLEKVSGAVRRIQRSVLTL